MKKLVPDPPHFKLLTPSDTCTRATPNPPAPTPAAIKD